MAISPLTAPLEAFDVSTQAGSRSSTSVGQTAHPGQVGAGGTSPPREAAVGMGGGPRPAPRPELPSLTCRAAALSLMRDRAGWGPETGVCRAGSGVRAGRSSGPRAFSGSPAPTGVSARPWLLVPASPDSGQAGCEPRGPLRPWGRAAEEAPSAAGHALSTWTWAARSLSRRLSLRVPVSPYGAGRGFRSREPERGSG